MEQGENGLRTQALEKTYFEWLRNIEPWCVSRQLWWGHQHPGLVRAGWRDLRRGDRKKPPTPPPRRSSARTSS
ncbi:class I tRNA ligase family protein [Caulobacter segnis]